MKKFIVLTSLVAILVGCDKESGQIAPITTEKEFSATIEMLSDISKTAVSGNLNMTWSQDDQIAVFHGRIPADKYMVSNESVGNSKGTFTLVDENNSSYSDRFAVNVAIYPYVDDLACAKTETGAYEITNFSLASVQTYASNTFANGTFPMVALTESLNDSKLNFRNVCGVIKLQLIGTDVVKSIKVTGNDNEMLSGSATISVYSDGTDPVINMTGTDEASKSVVLDCSVGVMLNEKTETAFYITLPPVTFEKGFNVSLTNDKGQVREIEVGKMSVHRSSVTVITNDSKSTLILHPSAEYDLSSRFSLSDLTNIKWTSSDENVVKVDNDGNVKAISDGKSDVMVSAGDSLVFTLTVIVDSPAKATVDYVDEFGVNHGKGLAIGRYVWAPVNCGYHKTEYPYGKLYQWGRKYGQGLGGEYDSHAPSLYGDDDNMSLEVGQSASMKDYFFSNVSKYPYEWLNNGDLLWYTVQEDGKGEYDPCPDGWRIPVIEELRSLTAKHEDFVIESKSMEFYGTGYDSDFVSNAKVMLPASGYRYDQNGTLYHVGEVGYYWSSSLTGGGAPRLYFYDYNNGQVDASNSLNYSFGCSIRCIQQR